MTDEKLAEARRYLSQLTPAMRKTMAVKLMQERLQREINEYVQEELSAGNSFYRAGNYEQAIKAWENIVELEPDNEAVKSKIERAHVIIENLTTLRERQTEKFSLPKTNSN
jgi:tetratricopeptide (TPR) repeat protein